MEVDKKTFLLDQARFIRIRVELPLEKLIRQGGWVVNPEGDQVRVGFKYECLVGLCYQCGRFGYEVKKCSSQRSTANGKTVWGVVEGGCTEEGECIRSGNLQPTNATNNVGKCCTNKGPNHNPCGDC